jgi:hypothetical protein
MDLVYNIRCNTRIVFEYETIRFPGRDESFPEIHMTKRSADRTQRRDLVVAAPIVSANIEPGS